MAFYQKDKKKNTMNISLVAYTFNNMPTPIKYYSLNEWYYLLRPVFSLKLNQYMVINTNYPVIF